MTGDIVVVLRRLGRLKSYVGCNERRSKAIGDRESRKGSNEN